MISSLEGIQRLENLNTLNVSQNHLEKLDHLANCKDLQTLICCSNNLETYESVAHLAECKNLSTVDLQSNKLEDSRVIEVFMQMPELR